MTATQTLEPATQEVSTRSERRRQPIVLVLAAIAALVIGGVIGWTLRGESGDAADVPEDVSALIDDWWAALNRADGSVVELYTPNGHHLYGDQRYSGESIATHLQGGDDHKWVTDPLLIVDEGDGRYVVAGGVSNSVLGRWYTSAITFEVVTTPDGLRFAHTAWSKVSRG